MNDDFIDQVFADLDEYYPGSKRKRRPEPEPEIKPDLGWDSNPYKKTLPNGQLVDMFTIGALASALGRPIITIRSWMKEGYLPTSPYRLPAKVDKNGDTRQGRRLYTRPMIEVTVDLFRRVGILHVKRVDWAKHGSLSQEIAKAWDNIRAEETN